jgi:carbon-monoxide dehydrogenase large subunit
MVHAAVLRSIHAHARIRAIDASRASQVDGVLVILTGEDVRDRISPFPASFEIHPSPWLEAVQPVFRESRPTVLAQGKVHYVGEPVAIVVAEDRYSAEDAVGAMIVDYEELPVVVDPEEALKPGATIVHDEHEDNLAFHFSIHKGDVDRAMQAAPRKISERFCHHRYCAVSMECRGVVASGGPKPGALTVWSSTQVPHSVRRQIAAQLGLVEEGIRVIAPNVGGGFGPKVFVYPEEILVAYLTLQLGRPVKWIEDRSENFISTAHGRDQIHDIELAFDEDGRILALRDRFLLDNGAYNPMGLTDAYNTSAHLQGPYKIPNLSVTGTCVSTNKVPNAPYRGAGRPEAVFVIERCIDRIAKEIGLDPVEVRLRNFIQPGDMPYDAGIIYRDGQPVCYDSGDFPATLKKALEAIGYEKLQRDQQALRERGRYLGIGISCYVEGTGVGSFEGAKVQIDSSGQIVVSVGASDHGQGHETVFSQVSADLWGMDPDQITVLGGDTNCIPYGGGTFASRSTVNASTAIYEASARLKEKVLKLSAHLLEANPADLEITQGKVFVRDLPRRAISFGELARAAVPGWASRLPDEMEPGLEASYYYVPKTVTWSNAAHIAVIEVDIGTGKVELKDYAVCHDSGRLVNPKLVDGQIHGGVAQGIGGALYEEVLYDDFGQILTGTFINYLVPSTMEIPKMRIVHLESPSPLNPLGVKGVGEGGAIAPPSAIANALVNALAPFGVEVNELPLKPDRVLKLLRRGMNHTTVE